MEALLALTLREKRSKSEEAFSAAPYRAEPRHVHSLLGVGQKNEAGLHPAPCHVRP
jgi:hypothetical protein